MAGRRTVDPDKVRTLADWTARWPKNANLAFDEEDRNPAIYSKDLTTKVKEIPWKREADVLVLLTQRDQFRVTAVDAAERRMAKVLEDRAQLVATAAEQLRAAEAAVLEAWRDYRAAAGDSGGRDGLMRDVMDAERIFQELSAQLAAQLYSDGDGGDTRMVVTEGQFTMVRAPLIPLEKRGIDIATLD